jgi:hypothetical protein
MLLTYLLRLKRIKEMSLIQELLLHLLGRCLNQGPIHSTGGGRIITVPE